MTHERNDDQAPGAPVAPRSDSLAGRVAAVAEAVVRELDLELYDVEVLGASGSGRTLRVSVDREGGVDLDTIAAVTTALSPRLDLDAAVEGPYLLEVSSPGLERALRRPGHFGRAVGSAVALKVRGDEGARRVSGTLVGADDRGCRVAVDGQEVAFTYAEITSARTVFEWKPSERPGSGGPRRSRAKEKSRS